jgi:hypothetical protein
MSDDIVARLCSWAEGDCVYHESVPDMLEAADEIERLQKIVAEYDRVRVEYLAAWEKWIKHHSDEDVVEWLRWYASEHPVSRPDGNAIEAIHCAIDKRCREAADEIEQLREELTASHESHGNEVGALKEMLSLSIHERDEARRECCMARAAIRWDLEHPKSPNRSETTIILLAWQISNERGWDCFREHKP